MSQSLTFAEAYSAQVRQRDLTTRASSQLFPRFNADALSDSLTKVVRLLEEEGSMSVLRHMKSTIKQIPAMFSNLIRAWVDADGLDILHHSIINNSPDMVAFLLAEQKFFPQEHMPALNPYAHLAAMFGHTECLRLILQYRPGDYFSGFKPSHAIKLPMNARKKLKPVDTLRTTVNKQIGKLLDKIKSSTETAENAILRVKVDDINEVGGVLTDELNALEKSSKKQIIKRYKGLTYTGKSAGAKKAEPTRKVEKPEKTEPHKILKPLVAKKGGHMLTVYWDIFSKSPQGVVGGAGPPVSVKFSEGYRKGDLNVLEIVEQQKKLPVFNLAKTDARPERQYLQAEGQVRKYSKRASRFKSDTNTTLPRILEAGIRGKKKYKDFQLKVDSHAGLAKDDSSTWRNKSPLSIAAEYGRLECVQMILETFILKNNPNMAVKEPLTLATKAKSPEAIMLLMDQKMSRADYQSAVLIAIREMYPDCLTALLAQKSKERQALFDGTNLFHILYTQSLMSDYRYEMMPVMTRVLINSKEDVNAHNSYCTFPMYTLINCAFNITTGKLIFYYLECLKILLDNKANPHFDEGKVAKVTTSGFSFARNCYSSAINCILENARNSVNFFENTFVSRIFMKKIMTTVTTYDRTHRRLLNDVLFNYMNSVCLLGLDRYIVRSLLRYGANPDYRSDGKYAINVYFDNILPYLAKFEVNSSSSKWQQELNALMLICRSMSYRYLKEAEIVFLNEHLLGCPIQALPICRYFSYLINEMLMTPRPLSELVAQFIWLRLKRNEKRVRALPLPDDIIAVILP